MSGEKLNLLRAYYPNLRPQILSQALDSVKDPEARQFLYINLRFTTKEPELKTEDCFIEMPFTHIPLPTDPHGDIEQEKDDGEFLTQLKHIALYRVMQHRRDPTGDLSETQSATEMLVRYLMEFNTGIRFFAMTINLVQSEVTFSKVLFLLPKPAKPQA